MQISEEIGDARYVIRGYEAGAITINQTRYTESLLLTPERLETGSIPGDVDALGAGHLQAIAALNPQIVILGTGIRLRKTTPAVTAFFVRQGIGIEVMNTGAACRTYNILMAEGRNIACALFLGD